MVEVTHQNQGGESQGMIVSKDLKTKGKDGKMIRSNLGLNMKESKKNPNEFKCYCGQGFNSQDSDFSNDIDMTGWDTSPSQQVNFKHAAWEPGYSKYLSSVWISLFLLY